MAIEGKDGREREFALGWCKGCGKTNQQSYADEWEGEKRPVCKSCGVELSRQIFRGRMIVFTDPDWVEEQGGDS